MNGKQRLRHLRTILPVILGRISWLRVTVFVSLMSSSSFQTGNNPHSTVASCSLNRPLSRTTFTFLKSVFSFFDKVKFDSTSARGRFDSPSPLKLAGLDDEVAIFNISRTVFASSCWFLVLRLLVTVQYVMAGFSRDFSTGTLPEILDDRNDGVRYRRRGIFLNVPD